MKKQKAEKLLKERGRQCSSLRSRRNREAVEGAGDVREAIKGTSKELLKEEEAQANEAVGGAGEGSAVELLKERAKAVELLEEQAKAVKLLKKAMALLEELANVVDC